MKFEIIVSVENVEGTQTFACEADNASEALDKFNSGQCDIIDEDLEVCGIGTPEPDCIFESDDISSRLPGDVLNKQIKDLQFKNNELVNCLKRFMDIVGDSDGVAGYHLNGDIAEWDDFNEVFMAAELLDEME